MLVLLLVVVFMWPAISHATTRYVDITLVSDCTSSNYSISARTCTGIDGNAYNTIAKGVTPTVAGDTLYLRSGTYPTNQRVDLQLENKSGSVGAYIKIAGFPGDSKPVLQYSEACCNLYGNIKARGNRGYFIFEDLVLDGVNLGDRTGWQVRDGNHHFEIRRIEIKNHFGNGLYFDNVDEILVEDNYIHDSRSDCVVGNRWHGFYVHHGGDIVIRRNKVEHMTGIGAQVFPGPWETVKIHDNQFLSNNHCLTTNNGGFVIFGHSSGGTINNVEVYNNVIADNGKPYDGHPGGAGGGMRILATNSTYLNNVQIINNTIVDNATNDSACTSTPCPDHEEGNAISILTGPSGIIIRNNILSGNENASIVDYGTGTIKEYNACKSGESCGSTGKVTLSASGPADCLVDYTAGADTRLRQGTNVCRNAGVATTLRPNAIGNPDIGAFEQGDISFASVVSGFIQLVASVMTPGVIPATGITGVTINCVGCSGTPVASMVNVKSGSNNIIQVSVSGITANGTCTVSLGSTNATDSLLIGGPNGTAQGLNSVSALSVTGTCQNTAGGGGGVTASWSHFPLNEGSGTTANDDTGEAHHGTVSAGVTWVSDASGTGVSIPTDATYRHVGSTYGSGVNPSSQDFTVCARVKLDSVASQKVVISSGGNGTSQRWYGGIAIVGGQPQWGIGIQGSGFTTGSEFVATTNLTFVCMVNDSAADTSTLWVDGVKGTQTGKSVKSLTSFTLVGDLRVGNDGTNTVNNGGYTVYDIWVWDTKPAESDIPNLYASFTPTSTTPCLEQTHVQFERVYTTSALAPVVLTANGDGSINVMPNGGVAFRIQYTCTGSAGSTVSLRLYYSRDGVLFDLPVPELLGTANVAMWGTDTNMYLNDGASTGCIDATGLTANSGVTVVNSVAGATFVLSQNHCRTDRYIVRVGNIPGESVWVKVKTDAGDEFANGYTQVVKVNVILPEASGGF